MDVEKNLLRLVALLAAIAGIGAVYEWKFAQDRDVLVMEEVLKFNRQQARLNEEERRLDEAARTLYERVQRGDLRVEAHR